MVVDFYELLGIPMGAGSREIKGAYRRMAEVYHPDKLNLLPESTREEGRDIMRLLNEAKDTLLNPERRSQYDLLLTWKARTVIVNEMEFIEPEVVSAKVKGEGILSKMSRVLDSMREAYSLDRDFTAKIVQAQEIVEARVLEEDGVEDGEKGTGVEGGPDLEMTLRFSILKKGEKKSAKPGKKGFRIVAMEGSDDGAVDADWEDDDESVDSSYPRESIRSDDDETEVSPNLRESIRSDDNETDVSSNLRDDNESVDSSDPQGSDLEDSDLEEDVEDAQDEGAGKTRVVLEEEE